MVVPTGNALANVLLHLHPLLGIFEAGKHFGRVAFVRCLPNGCVAEVVLDDDLVKKLSDGTSAIFVVFKTPEEGVGIPVSLKGFADGFAQLP